MAFALDNADAAGQVVEVLTKSLTLKETPIPTKFVRLVLVSDILHNGSAPVKMASAYKSSSSYVMVAMLSPNSNAKTPGLTVQVEAARKHDLNFVED